MDINNYIWDSKWSALWGLQELKRQENNFLLEDHLRQCRELALELAMILRKVSLKSPVVI